jgi:hypothetical protein
MRKFIEERARMVRSLADKADPFVKRRLLALAERYETQLASPRKATETLREVRSVPTFFNAEGER